MAPAAIGPDDRGPSVTGAVRRAAAAVAVLAVLALCARELSDPPPSMRGPAPVAPAPVAPVPAGTAPVGAAPIPPISTWAKVRISVLAEGADPPRRRIRGFDDFDGMERDTGREPLDDVHRVNEGRIEDVIVFAEPVGPLAALPAPEDKVVMLEVVGSHYLPRVLTATVGQTLVVRAVRGRTHGHHFRSAGNGRANVHLQNGKDMRHPLVAPELGISIGCDAHVWLEAPICVFSHPFHGATGADGTATLRLPAGTYRVGAWHRSRWWTPPAPVTVAVAPVESRDVEFRFREKER